MLGITLNIIVLFSLILVAGLLVDAVIVTTEFADTRLSKGINRFQAYKDGASRMFWPITSSTATTLMVFLPLLFWPGIVGQFMKYLPITMIFVLTSSLLMALIFVPVIGSLFGKKPKRILHKTISTKVLQINIKIFYQTSYYNNATYFFNNWDFFLYIFKWVWVFPSFQISSQKKQKFKSFLGEIFLLPKDNIVKSAEKALKFPEGVDIIYARSKNPENNDPRDSIGKYDTLQIGRKENQLIK